MLAPYSHKHGQRITTDARGVAADRAFLAHIEIPAAKAPAASSDAVHAAINLVAEVQSVTTGITNPGWARNIRIDGNVSGINGKVKIHGTNFRGETITEEIQANGTTAVDGTLAFRTVTKIDLPVRNHTPVAQVETATAAGTVTQAGNALVTVTSSLFDDPIAIDVPVEVDDGANDIAAAIRTTLAANADIAEHFTVSGADAAIILTAKVPAANDDTLNIAIADGTGDGASQGVTTKATSANTTAGVPYDQISVGFGDILGLPYLLTHKTIIKTYFDDVEESNAPTITIDEDEIHKNTIDLHSALNGKKIDIYLIV